MFISRSLVAWRRACVAFAVCSAVTGCNSDDVADRLELTLAVEEPVVLETACEGPACENSITLLIEYPADYTVADTVQLEQYRVDYDLAGVRREVPFYAEPIDVELVPGETTPIELRLLGETQREAIVAEVEDAVVRGTVHVTLAGYDFDDRQVFPEIDIDVELRPSREGDFDRVDLDDSSTTDGGDGQ